MRHDRAKSSRFEFIGVEKECYEMERAIDKTGTKRKRGEEEASEEEGKMEDNVLPSKIILKHLLNIFHSFYSIAIAL